jgi:membrane protein DedA with SNARE-associated domain
MSLLVWVMMAIAIWHFTIWLPDHFYGGIVGVFLAAIVSAVIICFIANGLSVPGRHDTHFVQALLAVPASLVGIGISYWWGLRHEREEAALHA